MKYSPAIFQQMNASEKDYLFLYLKAFLPTLDNKNLKSFLLGLWEQEELSCYHRSKCLELIASLVMLDKMRPSVLIDKLLDVDDTYDLQVKIKTLQLSYGFYQFDIDNVIQWVKGFLDINDLELKSEAAYAFGRIMFNEAFSSADLLQVLQKLTQARQYFQTSAEMVENRVDSKVFAHICSFLIAVFSFESKADQLNAPLLLIQGYFRQYIQMSFGNTHLLTFCEFIDALTTIKEIALARPDSWLDFKLEFNRLGWLLNQLSVEELNKDCFGSKSQDYVGKVKTFFLRELFPVRFFYECNRLKALLATDSPEVQRQLLNDLIASVQHMVGKNVTGGNTTNSAELMIKMHRLFPAIPVEKIRSDVQSDNLNDGASIVNLISRYQTMTFETEQLNTGFFQGDELVKRVVNDLQILESFTNEKKVEFYGVLKDVVNYLVRAMRGGNTIFDFLYNPKALEKEMQESLLNVLQSGPRASCYHAEMQHAGDGGRCDLLYLGKNIEVPIELKRSFNSLNWNDVAKQYIAQAQSYTHTRDQIAFFILLDLSSQKKDRPEAHINDLLKVISLPPRQAINVNFPSQVIAVILPGNKLKPSQRSSY